MRGSSARSSTPGHEHTGSHCFPICRHPSMELSLGSCCSPFFWRLHQLLAHGRGGGRAWSDRLSAVRPRGSLDQAVITNLLDISLFAIFVRPMLRSFCGSGGIRRMTLVVGPGLEAEEFVAPRMEDGAARPKNWFIGSFEERYRSYRPSVEFYRRNPTDRYDAYRVSPGFVMLVVDADSPRQFERRRSGHDIVEFHFRHSGTLVLVGAWGELRVPDSSNLIWYQPNCCSDVAERVESCARQTWVSLYCDREWLCGHAGRYATKLLDSLAEGGGCRGSLGAPWFIEQPQCYSIADITNRLLQTRGDGALDWLYCITKATELLYVTLKLALSARGSNLTRRHVSEADQRALLRARELLKAQFATPPQLTSLARQVGLNPSKLCTLFQDRFGESLFDFVRRQRLEHAQELLTRSGLQIRQIATAVGYRHHSTFTAAFTRHFGLAPKRAQRSMYDPAVRPTFGAGS